MYIVHFKALFNAKIPFQPLTPVPSLCPGHYLVRSSGSSLNPLVCLIFLRYVCSHLIEKEGSRREASCWGQSGRLHSHHRTDCSMFQFATSTHFPFNTLLHSKIEKSQFICIVEEATLQLQLVTVQTANALNWLYTVIFNMIFLSKRDKNHIL